MHEAQPGKTASRREEDEESSSASDSEEEGDESRPSGIDGRQHAHALGHSGRHGGFRHKVGWVLESWMAELAIVTLIAVDVGIIAAEYGLESKMFCVNGVVLPVPPAELKRRIHASGISGEQPLTDADGRPVVDDVASVEAALKVVDVAPEDLPATERDPATVAWGYAPQGPPDLHELAWNWMDGEKVLNISSSGRSLMQTFRATSFSRSNGSSRNPEGEASAHSSDAGHSGGEHGGHPVPTTSLVCEGQHGSNMHSVAHTCHFWSVLILVIFEVELLLKMWVHPSHFFKSKLHVLDFCVVTLSLALDLLVPIIIDWSKRNNWTKSADLMTSVLLLARLWRVARVFHGIFETAHKAYKRVGKLRNEVKSLKEKLKEAEDNLAKMRPRTK